MTSAPASSSCVMVEPSFASIVTVLLAPSPVMDLTVPASLAV
eukprot:CAMPEP_0117567370 /NCGR_PEP_ID=MMETSP0784-20121206/57566_1 /TAXON_ID=39447 /ORGANISM="" /LENGTH=41 /DNA_ID= /DNA_START= /DNA_END= /DNA_ORIENTATION=